MDKITRGEWRITSDKNDEIEISSDEWSSFAVCFKHYKHKGEAEANAKLIAAAPDLYEALQFIVNKLDMSGNMSVAAKEYYKEAVDKAKAAISKATN